MRAGIIAAGTGERLARSGITVPKPLVQVAGRPLIARIMDAAARLHVESVACIVNDLDLSVAAFLRSHCWPVPLELLVKTTPHSMESFFSLAPVLGEEPFILFTVDVVFGFGAVEKFVQEAQSMTYAQGVLALTDFVDDEKPLWVQVDHGRRITALGASAQGSQFITSGFYYFDPCVFSLVSVARQRQLGALRQFLGLLIENDYALYGLPVEKTIDVDYAEDIIKAESYLKEINEA